MYPSPGVINPPSAEVREIWIPNNSPRKHPTPEGTPPKTNMEPKNWCFVNVSPFPFGGIFRVQPFVFRGVFACSLCNFSTWEAKASPQTTSRRAIMSSCLDQWLFLGSPKRWAWDYIYIYNPQTKARTISGI